MSRYTFNIEVNKRGTTNKKKDKLYPIWIRVYDSVTQQIHRVSTGVKLTTLSSWNERKLEIRKNAEDGQAEELNELIYSKLHELKQNYQRVEKGEIASIESITESNNEDKSFLNFIATMRDDIIADGKINYGKRFNTLYKKISMFLKSNKKKDLLFSDVDYEFCVRYESFLKRQPNKFDKNKMLGQAAIAEQLTMLKTAVRKAVKMKKILPQDNPFIQFTYSHGKSKTKEKLNFDEIKRMESLEFGKTEQDYQLLVARDTFLFSFFAAGMRFEDVTMLRWHNIYIENNSMRIKYHMHKNGKSCDWILVANAVDILKRWYDKGKSHQTDYVFPLLNINEEYSKATCYEDIAVMNPVIKQKLFRDISTQNAIINRALKQVTELSNIHKSISFHCARHSVANLALNEGIGLDRIRAILKHTNFSTTQKYVSDFTTSANDQTLQDIFGTRPSTSIQIIMQQISLLNDEEMVQFIEEFNKTYTNSHQL